MSPVRAAAGALFGEPGAKSSPRAVSRPPAPGRAQAALLSLDRLDVLLILAVGVVALVAAAFSPRMFADGDTFWHLAAGGWMLDHRAILHADPFSYTAPGKAWDTHEWLTEIVMTAVWRPFGWAALQLLFAAAVAATAMIMAGALLRKLPLAGWLAMLALALASTTQSWLARPHLLVLPLLALWTAELIRAREAGRPPSLWLLPVMTLWANLHGSFLLGLALVAPLGCEAVLAAESGRLRVARDWLLFLLGAVAAAAICPNGMGGLLFPIKLMSMRTLHDIQEWRAADFNSLHPFELAVLGGLYVLLSRGVRIPMLRLLTILGLLHLALHEARHELVFAVTAPLLLADALGRALQPDGAATRPAPGPRLTAAAVGALALATLAVAGLRLAIPDTPKDSPTAPGAALAHVPAALRAQPVLNEYGMGGFLIFHGVRPFIDGRADMYGDAFFDAYLKAVQPDRARLMALLARYKVRWTILDAKDPAVQLLDLTPGWKRLYADKFAVVQVRTG